MLKYIFIVECIVSSINKIDAPVQSKINERTFGYRQAAGQCLGRAGRQTVMAKMHVKCLCHKNKPKPVNIPYKKQVTPLQLDGRLLSFTRACFNLPASGSSV